VPQCAGYVGEINKEITAEHDKNDALIGEVYNHIKGDHDCSISHLVDRMKDKNVKMKEEKLKRIKDMQEGKNVTGPDEAKHLMTTLFLVIIGVLVFLLLNGYGAGANGEVDYVNIITDGTVFKVEKNVLMSVEGSRM